MHLLKTAIGLFLAYPVTAALSATLIYEFPSPPYFDLENVAVRPNGSLLLTSINHAAVYTLNPAESQPTPSLVYAFPTGNSTVGITQTSHDVYAVVVGEYNIATFGGIVGSFSVWSVNLQCATPVVSQIAKITSAHALNGMCTIPSNPNVVLIADSVLGQVYSLNTQTGVYTVAIASADFAPIAKFPLGINGLHVKNSTLYFTNSAQGLYGSIPISSSGIPTGCPTILAKSPPGQTYDDFALDASGDAWIATHPYGLLQVTTGKVQTVQVGGGNSTQLNQPTSAVFGTGANICTLYLVTAGNGTSSGQIFSAKTC